MATKKSTARPSREVQKAWKHAQRAWVRVEDSLASLIERDRVLVQKLRKAGGRLAHDAGAEVRSVVRDLERRRKTVLKRFDRIVGRHRVLRKSAA